MSLRIRFTSLEGKLVNLDYQNTIFESKLCLDEPEDKDKYIIPGYYDDDDEPAYDTESWDRVYRIFIYSGRNSYSMQDHIKFKDKEEVIKFFNIIHKFEYPESYIIDLDEKFEEYFIDMKEAY